MTDSPYKIEAVYTATGTGERPGGQHAGDPPASVRVTHVETGILAQCGEARSQFRNKQIALEMVQWALVCLGREAEPLP